MIIFASISILLAINNLFASNSGESLLNIGNKVTIAAKSGVTKNIHDNSIIAGFPAQDIKKWKKSIINQYRNIQ